MAKASHGRCRALERAGVELLGASAPRSWPLSPTDLTFIWSECPRCFYRKVVLGQPRPTAPFPQLFNRIDSAMKRCFLGERTDQVAGAPPGVVVTVDRWVKSAPIRLPGCSSSLVIRGRLDALIACDDGSASVVDFKTADPKDSHLAAYSRQLHAYGLCLEYPAVGNPVEVSGLGLLCFSPSVFRAQGPEATLSGGLAYVEVPRDEAGFEAFLGEVTAVLECDEPPAPAPSCSFCAWGEAKKASRPFDIAI